jgi:hypothetical protein
MDREDVMDERLLDQVLADFAVYTAMIRKFGAPPGAEITGGCYDADHHSWSRVKKVRVHYDQEFRPRKIEHLDLGVTYRLR